MGQKVLILFCIQLIFLIGIKSLIILTVPPRPTPPPVAVPYFINCTKYSTATEYWADYTYQGQPSRYCYLYPNGITFASSWHEAYDNCRKRGATLVSIHDFTTNYILSHPLMLKYGMGSIYWIGLNSLNGRAGDYRWSDKSPVQFYRWALTTSLGTPLPPNIRDQGRCVSMRVTAQNYVYKDYFNNTGLWFKDDCNLNHQYICKKDSTPVPPLPTPPAGGCPAGWYNANQKCIKYIETPKNYNQARTVCESYNNSNGDLLTIHTPQEQDFVTAMTVGLEQPYIGMTQQQSYYGWSWADQSRVTYTNWGIQPPVYYFSKQNCAIVVTNSSQPGKWIKVNCTEPRPFICQINRNPNIKAGIDFASQKCNITGLSSFVQYRNNCYDIVEVTNQLSFVDAQTHCQNSGPNTSLVSITNAFEQAFLKYYINQYGKSSMYLIGLQSKALSDTNDTQMFEWTDHWPLYYSNWLDNEPRLLPKPTDQCVVMLKGNRTTTWKTTDCNTPFAFICKYSKTPVPKVSGPVNGVCPKLIGNTDKTLDWVNLHKGQQYCYWFSTERKGIAGSTGLQSWSDASFHCRRRNGTLASIHSKHDSMILLQRLSKNPTFSQFIYYGSWIGLSKSIDDLLLWEDNSPVDYTEWAPNERFQNSSDLNDDTGRVCVEMTSDGMWRQAACAGNKRDYFVCQINKLYAPKIIARTDGSPSNGGKTAGIVIGVLLIIGALVAIGFYLYRRSGLKVPQVSSFDNPLSRSQRGQGIRPQQFQNNKQSSSHLTNNGNENPFAEKFSE